MDANLYIKEELNQLAENARKSNDTGQLHLLAAIDEMENKHFLSACLCQLLALRSIGYDFRKISVLLAGEFRAEMSRWEVRNKLI